MVMPLPWSGCWIWMGRVNEKGYGMAGKAGRERVHRLSWREHRGPITIADCVLHKCDNPSCLNPDHLFLGDRALNNKDMREKGRDAHGERSPWAKLSVEQVRKIRSSKKGHRALGREYGVTHERIRRIRLRVAWRSV
jgi:hypothetical protein